MYNKVYTNLYTNYVKNYYKLVYKEFDVEDVYYHKNRLVVLVRNEETGKQIYEIVKSLKDRDVTISIHNISFKIKKYIADNQNRVILFCIDFSLKENRSEFFKYRIVQELADTISEIRDNGYVQDFKFEKLQELVTFVEDMKNNGYVLDDSKIDSYKFNYISTFLSYFVSNDKSVTSSGGALIKHIHYVLSDGKDFNEFYEKIVNNNLICKAIDFPYALPLIKMCYNFFVTGTVPDNINEVLNKANVNKYFGWFYENYLIANRSSFESNFKVIESNEEYTIYDENYKIYHNNSSEFEKFLDDSEKRFISNQETFEKIGSIILDFEGNIIGYQFLPVEKKNSYTVFEKTFKSQQKILDFIVNMNDYIFNVKRKLKSKVDTNNSNFIIDNSLICLKDTFKITDAKQLFNLESENGICLRKQITTIFFKLYLTYLNQKYGEMFDKKQFLEKKEVKYLSPVLAREFINYALEKQTDYEVASKELYNFLYHTRKNVNTFFCYDSRFEYNPLQTPFIFKDEAEKKYGIKLEKGINEKLSDGRTLVIFDRSKKISDVKYREVKIQTDISETLGNIEDYNVKIVGISEIIYSYNINDENMYDVMGYITEPIKGQQLTNDVILNLSNKDLLKVFGYLFTKFDKFYIPWDSWNLIWMDNNFKFYINILDNSFQIKKCRDIGFFSTYIGQLARALEQKGYNPNAFVDLDFSQGKDYYLRLANSLDAYCEEHGIYYNSLDKACPICLKTKYYVSLYKLSSSKPVFEDLYAKHYKLYNTDYNLKVYKTSCENIAELEKNVDTIINGQFLYNKGQDCFIPIKKAIDKKNNRFIGYIYDSVEFDNTLSDTNVCIDIKDSQKLKNLPKLLSLIRLMLQVKEITSPFGVSSTNNVGFINNPFTYVFLNKSHKKQVQILNIDFFSEKGNVENTLKWTCEYVCEILASDDSIEVDISDCSTNLDSILEKLQALSKDMTKYCSIHGMYYKSDYLFCPKCVDKVQAEKISKKTVYKNHFSQHMQINEGGESFIYSYKNDLVAKVFKEDVNLDFKATIIYRVLQKQDVLEGVNRKNLKYKYIIPKTLLIDAETDKILGYDMNKVSGIPFSSLRDKAEVKRLGITRRDVLEILIAVGQGIETLHQNNIFIGDLNGRNILFDTQKNVYFLDFDGMGVDEISPEFCTDGYIDPISKKNQNITMKDDWYSFAVQAFYYLTFTHPFNGIYSVYENNKNVNLDIPAKMERRISLLGNHGIKVPAIAEPWDWMDKELKTAFLNIFESDSRESIVPHLIRQYENLYKGIEPDNESFRINSKFVAKELIPFGENAVHIINHYAAVCKNENEYYFRILLNNNDLIINNFDFFKYENINNILLSEDEKKVFIVYEDKMIIIDLQTNKKTEYSDIKNVVVNGNAVYCIGNSVEKENVISQIEFMSNGDVNEKEIKFLTEQKTMCFCAKFNSKYVTVKRTSDNVDEIYCNSEKLCNMNYSSENSKYNIIYDDTTNLWLIINSEGQGIIINASKGTYERISIQESINEINIDNISFDKGIIYIPNQDYLHLININDQTTTKKMECHIIMTSNSKLYDINTKGFSVITNNKLYEIRRG